MHEQRGKTTNHNKPRERERREREKEREREGGGGGGFERGCEREMEINHKELL